MKWRVGGIAAREAQVGTVAAAWRHRWTQRSQVPVRLGRAKSLARPRIVLALPRSSLWAPWQVALSRQFAVYSPSLV